ncbi:MFS transporter [Streptomyces sp. A1277]|uniref:MFS transporter n=1 Tax=Streptomyces sp. A1277 TaxID=2563103 RepID=UPI0010A237AE|nr:MFS transporter [Streptomyces sp. A1277]THA30382.1 MFS transporter [Streptomyces sp. A1277]
MHTRAREDDGALNRQEGFSDTREHPGGGEAGPDRPPHGAGPDAPWPGVPAFVAATTAVAGIGLAAGGTAGALLATELAGTASVAGLPVALHLGGSAVGALLVSHQAGRGHRGRGLALGLILGALGALAVVLAARQGSLAWMLAGSALLGTANSSIFLLRYTAAQAVPEGSRGRALGAVFLATAVGAVISPLLLGPSGLAARAAGLPTLCGLYLVAIVAFGCSALMLAAGCSPRTPLLGRAAGVLASGTRPTRGTVRLGAALREPAAVVALSALAGANFIMVGIMTITPVHLSRHGAGTGVVGSFVALHVVGMFAPAPLVGRLADRYGPVPVVLVGAVISLAACALGGFSTGPTTMTTAHLVLAGLGWNFGVVGASTLLTQAVPGQLRPYVEGIGEATMGAAAMVVAPLVATFPGAWGYQLLALLALALTALALARLRVPATAAGPLS